jgi:hypothetical protein
MDFHMFQTACREIAKKRSATNGDIQELVAGSTGPVLTGTKQDAVRFYDDKKSFTGAAAHNDNFEGTDTTHGGDRHGAQQARTDAALHSGKAAIEADWGPVQVTFDSFAGPERKMEGREFKKMCDEIPGLIGGGFTKNDVDIVFTACKGKGGNYILFDGFQDVCRRVAAKKDSTTAVVQEIVAASKGPHLNATQADAVRFHDDKNLYTGAHAEKGGRDGHDDGRHDRIAAQHASLNEAGEDEDPWDGCEEVFAMFCEGQDTMEGRQWMKLCVDAKLLGTGFAKTDVDIVFSAVAPKGGRRLDANDFKIALRNVAVKKKIATNEVQAMVQRAEVHNTGTVGEYNKFHDDKNLYTGMHAEQ